MEPRIWTRTLRAFLMVGFGALLSLHASTQDFPGYSIEAEYVPDQVIYGLSDEQDSRDYSPPPIGTVIKEIPDGAAYVMQLDTGITVEEAIAILTADPTVAYAEPNYLCYLNSVTPNDTYFSTSQWAPQRVQANLAWEVWHPELATPPNTEIRIAILDTGVRESHQDLLPKIARDQYNGIRAYNAITDVYGSVGDAYGHGTICAGIAAAAISNSLGVAGISGWDGIVSHTNTLTRIVPVKVMNDSGGGTVADISSGIYWASSPSGGQANILSLSIGVAATSTTLANAVSQATGTSRNCIIVASAGNEYGVSTIQYPAGYASGNPKVIAVASTDRNQSSGKDSLAVFSRHGSWINAAAPGYDIWSTSATGDSAYSNLFRGQSINGTSFACPLVAGEAALILHQYPSLTAVQVVTLIVSNNDGIYDSHPVNGVQRKIGSGKGRVNIYKALPKNLASLTLSATTVKGGESLTGTVTFDGPIPNNIPGGVSVVLSCSPVGAVTFSPTSLAFSAGSTQKTVSITASSSIVNTTPVTITASYKGVQKNANMTITGYYLATLAFNTNPVIGGVSVYTTVTLNETNHTGNAIAVGLQSDNGAATVPSTVYVQNNSIGATFYTTTSVVSQRTTANITASLNGGIKTAALNIDPQPAALASLAISPTSVTGGLVPYPKGTVRLTAGAPVGGLTVALSVVSGGTEVSVPANIAFAQGEIVKDVDITTYAIAGSSDVAATIRASYSGVNKDASLTVKRPVVTSLSFSVNPMYGGNACMGTVALSGPAPAGGAAVSLYSSAYQVGVPSSVTIPAGQTMSSPFTVTTTPVSYQMNVTVTATYISPGFMATLQLLPPTLQTFTLDPAVVTAGNVSYGAITLTGPAPQNMSVALTSGNPARVTVPANVIVLQGQATAIFQISTAFITGSYPTVVVVLTARLGSTASLTATLHVNHPEATPLTGTVKLKDWNGSGISISSLPVLVVVDGTQNMLLPGLTGTGNTGTFNIMLASAGTHTIWVKPFGFLAQKITVTANYTPLYRNFFGPSSAGLLGGDADGDNVVGDGDLTAIVFDYGTPGGYNGYTDVNGDGLVDDADSTIAVLNYGEEGDE